MTKRAKAPSQSNLPATMLEAEAVPVIVGWIDRVKDKMTSDAGRAMLRASIYERLAAGTISRMKVVEAAESGHQDADLALRELAAEYLSRGEVPPTELAAYVQKVLFKSLPSYPKGRNLADTWVRDIGIAVLVHQAMELWELPKSRSHHSKSPARLSACYLVAVALVQRGIVLGERRVERIFDDHVKLAGRLSSFLPAL